MFSMTTSSLANMNRTCKAKYFKVYAKANFTLSCFVFNIRFQEEEEKNLKPDLFDITQFGLRSKKKYIALFWIRKQRKRIGNNH